MNYNNYNRFSPQRTYPVFLHSISSQIYKQLRTGEQEKRGENKLSGLTLEWKTTHDLSCLFDFKKKYGRQCKIFMIALRKNSTIKHRRSITPCSRHKKQCSEDEHSKRDVRNLTMDWKLGVLTYYPVRRMLSTWMCKKKMIRLYQ